MPAGSISSSYEVAIFVHFIVFVYGGLFFDLILVFKELGVVVVLHEVNV